MKKVLPIAIAFCMAVSLFAGTALAADSFSGETELFPVDVIQSPDNTELRKVYELSPGVDPGRLPRDSFERNGYAYNCTDILREVVIGEESKTITVTVAAESKKNDMDTVLGLFPQYEEFADEDGFTGTLLLNTASIKSKVSGYGSTSTPYAVTRSYPNLSDADTQYIPKTLDDNGKTLQLTDIQWQTDNTMNVDDYEIGDRYTAVASYGGTKTSSYVKGYNITADYTGEVTRRGVTVIRYTVIFTGVAIPVSASETADNSGTDSEQFSATQTKKSSGNWLPVLLSVLALLGSGAGVTYTVLNNRKEKTYETNTANARPDIFDDHTGGDHGSCGGKL
ncbi:MAG: cell wall protein [Oscillospiraceae bacterium]|jgi:hypothetical protein|nr:cell wall protein [Oscillospiraceae bacterium]